MGRLQEKYGIAKEEGREQIEEFKKSIDHLKKSNADLMRLQKALGTKKKKSNGISVKAKTSSR